VNRASCDALYCPKRCLTPSLPPVLPPSLPFPLTQDDQRNEETFAAGEIKAPADVPLPAFFGEQAGGKVREGGRKGGREGGSEFCVGMNDF